MEVINPKPSGGSSAPPAPDVMFDAGDAGAALTIDWSANGKLQECQVSENTVISFTDPADACSLKLKITNGGAFTATLPATIIWAQGIDPIITPVNLAVDIVALYFDGTEYYGSIIHNAS
jgi:hypothetical protein